MENQERRRYSDLLAEGLSREAIRSRVYSGELTRPIRGVYGPPGITGSDLRSLFVRLPPGSVLGYHSAATLFGLPVPPDNRTHVIIPAGADVPFIKGVAAHASTLPLGDPACWDGIPCVPPERLAVDLARLLRRIDALPLLDAALRAALCSPEQLAAEVARHAGLRGVRQARELIGWADPRAECVQESQLRLIMLDGRLPPPEPQIWVDDGHGRLIYRLDLAYRQQKVGIEYDGSSHIDVDRMHHDRFRHNWLADKGWRIRYFTARDLYRAPQSIVAAVRSLL